MFHILKRPGDFAQFAGHSAVEVVAVCDIDAILGQNGGKTHSAFPYAARMTEMALMGMIALCFPGRKLAWDAGAMSFPEVAEANRFVRRKYRKGREVARLWQRESRA